MVFMSLDVQEDTVVLSGLVPVSKDSPLEVAK
jgi:hypothetical protein